jgi:hypothetical protein
LLREKTRPERSQATFAFCLLSFADERNGIWLSRIYFLTAQNQEKHSILPARRQAAAAGGSALLSVQAGLSETGKSSGETRQHNFAHYAAGILLAQTTSP